MKKMLSILLASAMALSAVGGLAACGGEKTDNTITIWCPTAAKPAYEALVDGFKATDAKYKDYTFNFVVKAEGDVRSALSTDPAAGADIFFFESGQIQQMIESKYLEPLDVGSDRTITNKIKARDGEGSYAPIINKDGVAMAYPATADNGWFLWYRTDVYSAEDVKSLDTMIEKAQAADKKIMMNYGSAWYGSSFFFGLGCKSDYDSEGKEGTYEIDFDGKLGKAAGQAVQKYFSTKTIIKSTSDNALNDEIVKGLKDGSLAAGFCGTWIGENLKTAVGESYDTLIAQTIAPKFKATVDGVESDYQITAFTGGKYCGVNARKTDKKKMEVAIAFADWMTNEAGQTKRFEVTKAGPTNNKVAASDAVKADKALAALANQAANGGYVQLKQPGEFWTQIASYFDGCYGGTITADNYATKLAECIEAIRLKA